MIREYRAVREAARRVHRAVEGTVTAHREERILQEPQFTDRMLGGIESALSGFETKGVRWQAMTLTDHGRGAQEKLYGADFMGVLSIRLPDFRVDKGFLAQAKLIRPGTPIGLAKLKEQCELMLQLSTESFVFLYDTHRVSVVPAISVAGATISPTELYSRSAARFFEEHFESFIGDRGIASPTPDTLVSLCEAYRSRNLIYIKADMGEIADEEPLNRKRRRLSNDLRIDVQGSQQASERAHTSADEPPRRAEATLFREHPGP
jgi:hypothetical protein